MREGDAEPGVSVLIVAHGERDVLAETLRSLAAERDRPGSPVLEVIVADNASPDDTVAMVERDFPWVRVLALGENLGFGAANNRAARVARGDLLLLLNSDARPRPGCLDRLVSALRAHPRAGAACPRLEYTDGRPQFHWAPTTGVAGEAVQMLRNRFERFPWAHRPIRGPLVGRGWFTAACLMLRREAFTSIDGFDEGYFLYFEDVDLSLRLRRAGWRLLDVPDARAVHLKGGSQAAPALSAAGELAYRRSQLRYYATHRPRWEQKVLRAKLRRKFRRVDDPEHRRRLLALLG